MKALRRSIKSEKSDSKHGHHISISQKDAIAILPPKKVIRALYDYEANPEHPQELTFARGDFFHVIGRENDADWYEACNPSIPSARGFVPVDYFQVLGKNERDSAGSIASATSHRIPDNDSGYSDRSGGSAAPNGAEPGSRPIRFSKSVGKGSGAMVYGVIMYDFKAERADELDAKAGEAIIVIAQSNPEWFVAKPIGRLGGPGLIPVSFIEIRDMTTGQAVPNAQDAVQRAGVPKVEEWKRMAADYKNSSISLGKFETGAGPQSQGDDTSVPGAGQSYPNTPSNGEYPHNYQHSQRTPGLSSQRSGSRPSSSQPLYPVAAAIPRWRFVNDKYWYIVEAVMQDGSRWRLSRLYSDFYDFQIALLTDFPEEAGNTGKPRTLPFMPGPVTYVTDVISNGRQQNLDEYIQKMLRMPTHISRCHLIRNLFTPREGDHEVGADGSPEPFNRLSDVSQQSSTDSPEDASRQSSRANLNGAGPAQPGLSAPPRSGGQPGPGQGPSNGPAGAAQYRSMSELRLPELDRQASSLTQASNGSQPSATSAGQGGGALKIKVYYSDEIIAIRVPTDISFQRLREKLKERLLVGDEIAVQYKDEPSNEYIDMRSDNDLDVALQRNPKLTLYVSLQ
ncbi:MAG: bud emergence protein 1 [Thelocarpon impressellum]|nr:MAG: bud emergence protein 1 [Thelocarpon impressellum]